VIASHRGLDQAGTFLVAAARNQEACVARMRPVRRGRSGIDACREVPIDGVPDERAQFFVPHQASDSET
jgi:hypothetical protein